MIEAISTNIGTATKAYSETKLKTRLATSGRPEGPSTR